MSYRELRNLAEYCRVLGFPRLISVENFRVPNFKLVVELLEWMVKRFEPNALLSTNVESEQDRIIFIKSAVLLLLQNARLKLNPKKLYQADGHAVQELLIVAKRLYEATQTQPNEDLASQWSGMKSKMNAKMQEVRICRQLATQIPQTGASLFERLSKEAYYRKERNRATSRAIPLNEAERSVGQAITAIAGEANELLTKLNNVTNDEQGLDVKIERKQREFDQLQKRYAKLQSFRPQYMDEYEKYEAKLKDHYEACLASAFEDLSQVYVLKFRNLAYLQQLQSEVERADRQRLAEAERNMRNVVEKMRLEHSRSPPIDTTEAEEPTIEGERKAGRRVFGNMLGAGLSDEEDEEEEDGLVEQSDLSEDEQMRSQDHRHEERQPTAEEDEDEDKRPLSSGDDF